MKWASGGLKIKLFGVRGFFILQPSLSIMAFLLLVLAIGTLASPQPVGAGPAAAAAFNPEKQFTITKIEPYAAKEEVKIYFSQPVPLEVLQTAVRFLPRVKLDWLGSKMSPEGVLTLKGNYKYGREINDAARKHPSLPFDMVDRCIA